jgi:hypothetical protein
MLRWILGLLTAVSAGLLAPGTVLAQSGPPPLSGILPTLHRAVIAAEDQAFSSLTSTEPEDIRKARLDTVLHTNNLFAAQLSSFPLGSSAGGFTWTFEPVTGTFNRASDSFGPIYAVRALTIGRNRLNVGVNYQRVTFDHLDGRSLRGGELVGYTGLPNYLGDARRPDGVFFEESLDLQLSTDTLSTFVTYGVSDRLDVGVTVPISSVNVKATLTSQYSDTITGRPNPSRPAALCDSYYIPTIRERATSPFDPLPAGVTPNGCGFKAEASGAATGIGDIVVRSKYIFRRNHGGGLAGGVDVRLPTGDEQNLLGIAGAQARLYVAASTGLGRMYPHVNVGYTVSGASGAARASDSVLIAPPDEINYASGADFALSLRTTLALDIVGRTLRKIGTLEDVPSVFGTRGGDPNAERTLLQELRLTPGADLHLLLGSAGIKFNPFANLLVSANVLVPLSHRGLTANLTWLLGLDYSF